LAFINFIYDAKNSKIPLVLNLKTTHRLNKWMFKRNSGNFLSKWKIKNCLMWHIFAALDLNETRYKESYGNISKIWWKWYGWVILKN